MSIALITTSTKKRNGVYCCVIHETKYMYSDYSSQQRDEFIYEKMFFPQPFSIFLRSLRNIYKNTCAFIFLWSNQKQPSEMFYKKAVLKNFAIFTGKHLWWSLFLTKLQDFRPDSKRDSNTCIFLWILRNFEEHLFWRASANGCFRWRVHYYIVSNEKSSFMPKQISEYNKTIIMTHFLKDQMKCESDPSFFQLLIEKSQIRDINEEKRLYQTKDYCFLF